MPFLCVEIVENVPKKMRKFGKVAKNLSQIPEIQGIVELENKKSFTMKRNVTSLFASPPSGAELRRPIE